MRFLVAGASGFLGRHLVEGLRANGDEVRAWSGPRPSAPDQVRWDPARGALDPAALDGVDVVVNLAGSPTLGNPHSKTWARNLLESRVSTTRRAGRGDRRASRPAGVPGPERRRLVRRPRRGGRHRGVRQPRRRVHDERVPRVAGRRPPAVEAGARVCVLRTVPVVRPHGAAAPAADPAVQARSRRAAGRRAAVLPGDLPAGLGGAPRSTSATTVAQRPGQRVRPAHAHQRRVHPGPRPGAAPQGVPRVPAFVIKPGAGRMANEVLGSLNVVPEVLAGPGFEFQRPRRRRRARRGL